MHPKLSTSKEASALRGSSASGIGNYRDLVRTNGARARASFLVSVLLNDSSSPAESTSALLSLLEHADELLPALVEEDAIVLSELLGGIASSSIEEVRLTPDGATPGLKVIGTMTKAVEVPGGTNTLLHRFEHAGGVTVSVRSEHTLPGSTGATLRVVDEKTSSVIGEVALSPGHNRLSEFDATLPTDVKARLELAVPGEDGGSWFGSTIVHRSMPAGNAVEQLKARLRQARETAAPASVLRPVTGEPLKLADIARMHSLKGKFSGRRIFIMGNGPSLNRTPLELLEGEFVFGLNRISLLFDRIKWRPQFFTAFDVRVVPDNAKEFSELDIQYKFFSARYKKLLGEKSNHYWLHTKGFYDGFDGAFEPDVVYSGFGGGGTIAVSAIEIAFYMGFREIYLIGTDVSYAVPPTVVQSGADVFGDGVKLELQSTKDDDANHFDPRYFGAGKKWHNPNVRDMKIGFARAHSYIEERGGILRNATVGGALDEVPRVAFESLF